MALVTERPRSPVDTTKGSDGTYSYRSQRIIDVTPTAGDPIPMTYAAAFSAAVGAGINFDESFDADHPDAVVTGISSDYNVVAGMWTFTATYGDGVSSNFLAQPPTVRVEPYTFTEVSAFDMSDPPVQYTDTAGNLFDGGLEIERNGVVITYRKPANSFNAAMIFTYGNCVNSVPLIIPGIGTIPKGSAKFIPPAVADRVTSADNLYIELKFDCRPGQKSDGSDGWLKNVIDQGGRGYGRSDSGEPVIGIFTLGTGVAPQVKLDGEGMPLKPGYKVRPEKNSKELDPNSPPDDVGSQELVNTELSTSAYTVLSFKRYREVDLNPLLAG